MFLFIVVVYLVSSSICLGLFFSGEVVCVGMCV
jgi:hypothetical protein